MSRLIVVLLRDISVHFGLAEGLFRQVGTSIDSCEGLKPIGRKGARKEMRFSCKDQSGKIGYIILWLLGVPAGILVLIFLLRGCT